MKYFGFMLLLFCITSCNYFEKKKVNADDILNEELQSFNWKEVDEYPAFESCDSISIKNERKHCFEQTLINFITSNLSENLIVVTESLNDTVILEFQISEKGQLSILTIDSSEKIKDQIPNIDSLLTQSIQGLPEVFPAIKRGQQVITEFKLPILIKTD